MRQLLLIMLSLQKLIKQMNNEVLNRRGCS